MTALLYMIVCLCWGTTWLAIEIAVDSVPPLTSAGVRFLIAFPMFVAFAMSRHESILYPRRHLPFFLFITLFYFAVPYWMINFGEQFVSSGLTALLFSTMPVFILIFSWLILRDRIMLSQVLGILMGFFALTMIILGQGMHLSFSSVLGIAAILLAAAMHGLSSVVTKRFGGEIGIITFNTLPIGVAGLGLTASGIMLEQPDLSAVTMLSILALLYLGVVASVGGFIVYFHLLKQLRPVILSFVFMIFPAISVVIDSWYDHVPLNDHFVLFMIVLLVSFAITRFPVETLLPRWRKGAADA